MALVHQGATFVLANVVPNENQRGKVPTAELPKSPSNLRAGTKWNDISPPGTIVNKSLSVPETTVFGFKGVSKHGFADGCTVKMMDLSFAYPWGFTLRKLALRERMNGNAASSGSQSTIQLNGASQTFVAGAHKTCRKVGHMKWVVSIISPTSWRSWGGQKETITKGAEFRVKSHVVTGRKSEDTMKTARANEEFAGPRAKWG
jgi:hypothetical protein